MTPGGGIGGGPGGGIGGGPGGGGIIPGGGMGIGGGGIIPGGGGGGPIRACIFLDFSMSNAISSLR